jgi:hypothetical protein
LLYVKVLSFVFVFQAGNKHKHLSLCFSPATNFCICILHVVRCCASMTMSCFPWESVMPTIMEDTPDCCCVLSCVRRKIK